TPTDQHLDRVASFRRGHHFFRTISFIPSMTSICSATSRLSRAFSDSRSLSRRASGTSRSPNLLRQRKKVCSVRLCFLHRALIDMAPTSASRRMPMICSSVNRFFMELSLPVKGRELTSQMATRSVSGQGLGREIEDVHLSEEVPDLFVLGMVVCRDRSKSTGSLVIGG